MNMLGKMISKTLQNDPYCRTCSYCCVLALCVFLVENNDFLFAGRSGLEQDDMRILYRYLTTSLFPRHSEPEVSMSQWTEDVIVFSLDEKSLKLKF